MLNKQSKNLLPKKPKKKPIFFSFSFTSKLLGGVLILLYLMAYQPILAIPPVQKSLVLADFSQQQAINSSALTEGFALPHPGYLTTKFSSWHPGIDLAVGLGMPVHPIASGKVTEVNLGFLGLGHFVVIEHAQGFTSTNGHLGRVFVKTGDNVNKSSIIGEVGLTGHTSGPHTHLEITKDGKNIDPLTVLPKIDDWQPTPPLLPQQSPPDQPDLLHKFPSPG